MKHLKTKNVYVKKMFKFLIVYHHIFKTKAVTLKSNLVNNQINNIKQLSLVHCSFINKTKKSF